MEKWISVLDGRYEVSSLGRVRNGRTGRVRVLTNREGYLRFSTYDAELRKYNSERVHRLVCEAFHGPAPEDKPWALHRNGKSTDNRPENLYWGSPRDNVGDMFKHGTARMGGRISCDSGHVYDEVGFYLTKKGSRVCKGCRADKRVPPPPGDPRHGKKSTYDNLGCRCAGCKSAKSIWDAEYRGRSENGN